MKNKNIDKALFKEKIIVEAYRGSISHNLVIRDKGAKVITDDIDIITFYKYPLEYYFSLEGYHRVKNVYERKVGQIDLVAYEIRKAFYLLAKLNPNVTPILFLKPEHYIKTSDAFKLILCNKELFYSKVLIRDAYLGYAKNQFDQMTKEHKYFGYQGDKRKKQYKEIGYDAKRAQHAIRLLRVGTEWLRDGQPQIYRTTDREELLSIKLGEWKLEQIIKLFKKEIKVLEQVYANSKMQEHNSYSEINALLFEVLQ